MARLELALKAQKVPIFAEFDHDDNARKADMTLRPTQCAGVRQSARSAPS